MKLEELVGKTIRSVERKDIPDAMGISELSKIVCEITFTDGSSVTFNSSVKNRSTSTGCNGDEVDHYHPQLDLQ